MSAHVRVMRNRYGSDKAEHPWLVTCALCAGDLAAGIGSLLAAMMPSGVKGWAPTWQIAQDYAHRHAIEHEKTRCQTCLHLPAEPLASERTNA